MRKNSIKRFFFQVVLWVVLCSGEDRLFLKMNSFRLNSLVGGHTSCDIVNSIFFSFFSRFSLEREIRRGVYKDDTFTLFYFYFLLSFVDGYRIYLVFSFLWRNTATDSRWQSSTQRVIDAPTSRFIIRSSKDSEYSMGSIVVV